MNSKPLVLGLVAAGCIAAGAAGTFLAMRHTAPGELAPTAVQASADRTANASEPVTETEALVSDSSGSTAGAGSTSPSRPVASDPAVHSAPAAHRPATRPAARRTPARAAASPRPVAPSKAPSLPAANTRPADPIPPPIAAGSSTRDPGPAAPPAVPDSRPVAADAPRVPEPSREPERSYVEVVVPASAVIGLQVDRALSSETARVEDRVDARVTRDVMAGGQRAIPAGSRVIGSVVLVERGGKRKDAARLGVRIHTLVLADGSEVPLRTEAIFRDGDSPGHESSRKIGGAAVGGAILGAILGGGKGAVLGGATGAAGGTAAVMAGGRNPATLAAGSIVTARLSDPVTIQVEKE